MFFLFKLDSSVVTWCTKTDVTSYLAGDYFQFLAKSFSLVHDVTIEESSFK